MKLVWQVQFGKLVSLTVGQVHPAATQPTNEWTSSFLWQNDHKPLGSCTEGISCIFLASMEAKCIWPKETKSNTKSIEHWKTEDELEEGN